MEYFITLCELDLSDGSYTLTGKTRSGEAVQFLQALTKHEISAGSVPAKPQTDIWRRPPLTVQTVEDNAFINPILELISPNTHNPNTNCSIFTI